MGFDLFQSVRDSVFSFHNDLQLKKILVALFVSNMCSSMSLIQAINELPLNTDGTASLYASYLKKFSLFVRKTEVDDGSIYATKELFTDENSSGFLLKYFN